MAFTRKTVASYGLNEEQLEKVMTLYSTSLADYIPKAELQEKIEAAVEQAQKNAAPPDVTTTEAYKAVAEERDMLRALSGNDFASVKPKFREQVYKMLSREEGAEPIEKQLEAIKADYEEYFSGNGPTKEPPTTPQFAAGVTGSMPKGDQKPTFENLWGLGKRGD